MEFRLTGRNLELDPDLRSAAESMAESLEEEFERLTSVNMTLSREKYRQIAQVEVHLPGGRYVAREESADMVISMEQAAKKVAVQVRKLMDRRMDIKRQGPVPVPGEESGAEEWGEGEEERPE
ncbi:MAG: ribosome-associated translation inhibitor RaiA [bacterium]